MTSIMLSATAATSPLFLVTSSGVALASVRVSATDRHFDRAANKWISGDTTWYTVTAYGHLAENVKSSIKKGDRLIIVGKLKIREWEADGKHGTNVEIEADILGVDLSAGTAVYTRNVPRAAPRADAGRSVAAPDGETA